MLRILRQKQRGKELRRELKITYRMIYFPILIRFIGERSIGIRKCRFLIPLRMAMRSRKIMDLRNAYREEINLPGVIIIILRMYQITLKPIIMI